MAEMTITEAAAALGVSPGTLRRRARRGELPSRKDPKGRYLVEVDLGAAERERPHVPATNGAATAMQAAELMRLRQELDRVLRDVAHRDELLDESRRRADRAEREADRLAQQLAAATVRELQIMAQSDLYALGGPEAFEEQAPASDGVASGSEAPSGAADALPRKRWWQIWRRAPRSLAPPEGELP
jgi:excisionase family DNA binding protein